MIRIDNMSFSYNKIEILSMLSLDINDGDYVAIVGDNGSGKSTFIKCLLGINHVGHNMIQIDGVCITCFNKFHEIGYVPQSKNRISELPITSYELFKLISSDLDKIKSVCMRLDIEDLIHENIHNLSGGQRQRVNIAKAMLNEIRYLILDEPSTGLDSKSRKSLYELLHNLNQDGLTIIVVSHHLDEIENSVNQVIDLNGDNYA